MVRAHHGNLAHVEYCRACTFAVCIYNLMDVNCAKGYTCCLSAERLHFGIPRYQFQSLPCAVQIDVGIVHILEMPFSCPAVPEAEVALSCEVDASLRNALLTMRPRLDTVRSQKKFVLKRNGS